MVLIISESIDVSTKDVMDWLLPTSKVVRVNRHFQK